MKILIYTDNVTSNHILYYALGKLRGKEEIYFVNANEILNGALTTDIDLFVMPGGASRYKSAKLNGLANELIKQYVANGGRYLGICAGAYMACQVTYWAKGEPYEIIAKNELGFFPGNAVGPITTYGQGDNYNGTNPRVVQLDFQGSKVASLYIGGCQFQPNALEGYEVVATFADLPGQPAAVVTGQYGSGTWLLSSTHPEYDQEALDMLNFQVVGNDYQSYSQLSKNSQLNLDFFDELLSRLFN
ncbi:BPL-N domain-containing protein [Vibrio sonorensis]|uniref:BPL-N domain-containing protein n=1 Tax=Vibrio sonorensis TaxID=1004316 RepID=UPI0008D9FAEE|nr:BPL-N domain-containing protein [Vibrio sonorensis]